MSAENRRRVQLEQAAGGVAQDLARAATRARLCQGIGRRGNPLLLDSLRRLLRLLGGRIELDTKIVAAAPVPSGAIARMRSSQAKIRGRRTEHASPC
jgi:hypothetical protein